MPRYSIVVAFAASGIVGCGDNPGTGPADKATIQISPSTASLHANDTVRFTATVVDPNRHSLASSGILWSSSDTSRVKVDATGLARVVSAPLGALPVIIAATYTPVQEPKITATSQITTVSAPLSIWPDTSLLAIGMTQSVVARVVNARSGYPSPSVTLLDSATWTSSDPGIMTVDAKGTITAVAAGHAKVRATVSGVLAEADVYVTVLPKLKFVSVIGGVFQIDMAHAFLGNWFDQRSCGLTDAGDVYCWGVAQKWMGVTGRCEQTHRSGPASYSLFDYRCTSVPQRLPSSVKFSSIVSFLDRGCGISTTGGAYCWEAGFDGELGAGAGADLTQFGPKPISSSDTFTSLDWGGSSLGVCGLRTDGVVACPFVAGAAPNLITGSSWSLIGSETNCGIGTDSTAYCVTNGLAKQVWGSRHWKGIVASACALDLSGVVWCGSTTADPTVRPGPEPLLNLRAYSTNPTSSGSGACGLTAAGDLYCLSGSAMTLSTPDGIRLKSFAGHCGIGVDGLGYCWANGKFTRVPGQQ